MQKILFLLFLSTLTGLASISSAQDEISVADQISNLVVEKDYIQKELEKVRRENDTLLITIENLKKHVASNENKKGANITAYDDLILQKNALIRQITNIRQEKIILSQKIRNLEQKLKMSSVEKALDQSDQVKDLEGKLKGIQEELNGVTVKYQRAVQTVDQITTTNGDLRQQITELKTRLLNKDKEGKKLNESQLKIKEEMDGLSSANQDLENRIKELSARNKSLLKEKNSVQVEKASLVNDVRIMEEKLKSVDAAESKELEKLKNIIATNEMSYKKSLEEIKQANRAEMTRLQQQLDEISAADDRKEDALKEAKKVQEKGKITQVTNVNLRNQIEDLKETIAHQNKTINVTLRKEAEQFKQKIADLEKQAEESRLKNLEFIQQAKDPLIERVTELRKERDQLTRANTDLLKTIESLKPFRAKNRELQDLLKTRNKELDKINNKYVSLANKTQKSESGLTKKVAELKSSLDNVHKVHADTIAEVNAKHSEEKEYLKSQVENLAKELAEKTVAHDDKLSELNRKIEGQQEKIENTNNTKKDEIAKYEERIENLKQGHDQALREKIANYETEIERLKEARSQELKEKMTKYESSTEELKQTHDRELREKITKYEATIEELKQTSNLEIENLSAALKAKEQAVSSIVARAEEPLQKEIIQLKQTHNLKIKEAEDRFEASKEELAKLKDELRKIKTDNQEVVAENTASIDKLNAQIKKLTQNNDVHLRSITALETEKNALTEKYAEKDAAFLKESADNMAKERKISALTEEGKNNLDEIKGLLKEKDLLNKQITQLNAELAVKGNDIAEQIAQQTTPLNETIDTLKAELRVKDQQVAERDRTIAWIDEKHKTVNDLFSKSEQDNAILRKENEKLSSTIEDQKEDAANRLSQLTAERENSIAQITKQMDELAVTNEKKLAGQRGEYDRTIAGLEERLATKEKELKDAAGTYALLLKEKQTVTSELNDSLLSNKKLQNDIYDLSLVANTIDEVKASADNDIKKVEDELNTLKETLKTQKDSIASLTKRKNQQLKTIEELTTKNLKLEQSVETVTASLAQANNTIKAKRAEITEKEDRLTRSLTSVEDQQKVNAGFLAQNDALKSELQGLNDDFTAFKARALKDIENAKAPLQHRINVLEEEIIKLTHLNQDNIDTINRLEVANSNYHNQIFDLKKAKSDIEQEYILISKKLEELEENAPEEMEEVRRPLEASIKFLERKLLLVEKEKEALEDKVKSMDNITN